MSGNTIEAGVLLVDKPEGITSFKVVQRLKRILKIKKVGHAGTLDPLATGLLVVCIGRPATRLISQIMDGEKQYEGTIHLGVETETQDGEGEIVAKKEIGQIESVDVEKVLAKFQGTIMQVPPVYSALKHKGKPLYYYARKGIEIKKDPRPVTISLLERIGQFEKVEDENPYLNIRVNCSKGTYIRTLAADIGKEFGCGGHLVQLRRTRSGSFSVEDGVSWEELQEQDAAKTCFSKMLSVERVLKLLQ